MLASSERLSSSARALPSTTSDATSHFQHMSSHYSGSRASHRQPIVEQVTVSSARPEPARRSVPDVHRSTRHSRDRDLHLQTSRSPQHRTVEPTHDEAVELAEVGLSWGQRFECSHDLEDLQRAVEARERAFELMPEDHPDRLWLLDGLSLSLGHRFDHLGKLDDIERSITLGKQCVDCTPKDDPDYARRLSNLSDSLFSRYQHLGGLHDLRDSIEKQKATLSLTPEDHPDRTRRLSNLGGALRSLFERLGDIHDLEEAIATHRRAVDLTPEGHPKRPWRLDALANSLRSRFKRLSDIRDLEEAIAAGRESVELTPEGHPEHPRRLSNLAVSLDTRYELLGDARDLDEMIATDLLSVELTPESHPSRPLRLSNLADSLRARSKRFGDMQDLEEAVKTHTQAVDSTPEGHPERPVRLGHLADSLTQRYERLRDIRDLNGAITVHKLVLDCTPQNHPGRSECLLFLGFTLKTRLRCEPNKAHFDDALDCFMEATIQRLGNPTTRLKSARQCVSLLSKYPRFSSAELVLNAHSRIIEIFPEIVWLGHSLERRYEELAKLGPEVNATVSAFIKLQSRFQAIEWMEMGRSFVWAQMSSLREPLAELEKAHSKLADELRVVSSALQQSGGLSQSPPHTQGHSGGGASATLPRGETDHSMPDVHRGLAIRYERILKDIRAHPGFEDFLRPAKIKSMLSAIGQLNGPVVFINVHSSSCDALVLFPDGGTKHVALPNLTEKTAQTMRSRWIELVRSSGRRVRGSVAPLANDGPRMQLIVLEKVWTRIVKPILTALGFIDNPPSKTHLLPHITWCPMGPLTQLPLHAAGIYDQPWTSCSHVYDFVVSSYTPSLAALLRSHKQPGTYKLYRPNVLAIAQPNTPLYSALPNTRVECESLRAIMPERAFTLNVLVHREGTVAEVLDRMTRSQWLHLACHGMQDPNNPAQSAFALYDGHLTLGTLMSTVAESAELAFLSACQTATGDEKIPEESAHLAAGMLAAGFKGVIGTMWSIGDADAPIVVEAYYRELHKVRKSKRPGMVAPGYTGAAYALHKAARTLRQRVGEQNFMAWAPFVHFGV